MTASTATRRRPTTQPTADEKRSSAKIRERGEKLRKSGPDLSDAQIRHLLQREGFPLSGIAAYLRGEDQAEDEAPEKPPAAAPSRPPSSGSRAGGGLWQGPGTPAGVLLALICYPAGLAYLRGGGAGLRAWFRAKFLNQTTTDPGIASEAWLVPNSGSSSTSGTLASAAASITGRRRKNTAPPAGAGAAAVAFARSQIGKPYRWGGTGPNAWDCSGLTQAAWRAAGVRIPRNTTLQLGMLPSVKRADMAPGDLVFPDPGHVQIYAGGGRIIEAPRTGLDVRQTALGRVMAVRRPRVKGTQV